METDNKLSAFGGGLVLLLCLYLFWAVALVPHTASEPPWVFLDFANLIFHEAGHVIFMFFGDFMHVLGGSLTQLLVPGVVLGTFIYQGDGVGAGFSLFWLGESLSNVSYYISDARAEALPLLGGDTSGHDWHWLLSHTNSLNSDTAIGNGAHGLAVLIMLAGLVWIAYTTYSKMTQSS